VDQINESKSHQTEDLTGSAMTVNGRVNGDQLGFTLMHEHMFLEFFLHQGPRYNTPATEISLWNEKLSLGNLHYLREGKAIKDNLVLIDEEICINEVNYFKRYGGNTIVELTNIGLGRDPMALRRVSNATGLQVIMGSGWYEKRYYPENMDQLTVEYMTDEIIRDLTTGVNDTGIRSGIIGEVGINGNPITVNEEKSIRASGRASVATGAAISFHHGGTGRERFAVASMLREEGVDLTRVIYGHSNSYCADVPFLLELLDLGVYVQFDTLGRVGAPVARRASVPGPVVQGMHQVATDVLVAEAIPQLIQAGFEDRILLSQDVCTKVCLKSYGGMGYSFLQEKFLPYLIDQGVKPEQIIKMMIDNPRRVLTFVAPR
jgi:phosphotriesterase-related protein